MVDDYLESNHDVYSITWRHVWCHLESPCQV
jgi:hypothetical protein